MKFISVLKSALEKVLEKEIPLVRWVVIFGGAIFLRSFIEQFLAVSNPLTPLETIYEFLHNLYFFSIALVLLWIVLGLILRVRLQKLSYLLIFSVFFVIFPTLIDMARNHGEIYWSFYLLSSPAELLKQFFTFFGHLPSGIVYFGTKIVFLSAILVVFAIIWILTKNILKALLGAVSSYIVLFFMGSFPTLAYYAYVLFDPAKKIGVVRSFDIAAFFGAPKAVLGLAFPSLEYALAYKLNYLYFLLLFAILAVFFFLSNCEKLAAVVKNLRLPQILIHFGLFAVGLGLGILRFGENFELSFFSILAMLVALLSIWMSWEASVIVNDINDFEIDKITNANRPLPRGIFSRDEYRELGLFFFLLAILGGVTLGLPFAVLLVIYQILAWAYSARPFRLKKFPLVATFVSSLALSLILFSGYILMSPEQSVSGLSWRIIFLFIITYTLSLPLKDFKDTAGDKKYQVWTVPVIFGEGRARMIVAVSIFISFILPVFFLNEFKLFWPALLFGSISFLVVTSKKIGPRMILWPIIGLVACYGIILAKILFL